MKERNRFEIQRPDQLKTACDGKERKKKKKKKEALKSSDNSAGISC